MGISTANKATFNRKKIGIFLLDHAIEVILIVLVVALAFTVNNFMTWGNWMNILRANSLKGVMAFGMTMVIIAGLIDLSIGSTVASGRRYCRSLLPRFDGSRYGPDNRLYYRYRPVNPHGHRYWLDPWDFIS